MTSDVLPVKTCGVLTRVSSRGALPSTGTSQTTESVSGLVLAMVARVFPSGDTLTNPAFAIRCSLPNRLRLPIHLEQSICLTPERYDDR